MARIKNIKCELLAMFLTLACIAPCLGTDNPHPRGADGPDDQVIDLGTPDELWKEFMKIGDELSFMDRLEDSAENYRRALKLAEREFPPRDARTSLTLRNLAAVHYLQGEYDQGALLAERALAMREAEDGPEHTSIVKHLSCLAALYAEQGKYLDAERLLHRAIAIQEKLPQHDDRIVLARYLDNLSTVLCKSKKYQEAEPFSRRAVAICEAVCAPEDPLLGDYLFGLGFTLSGQARNDEAEKYMRRGLAILEIMPNQPRRPVILEAMPDRVRRRSLAMRQRDMAKFLCATGRIEEGLAFFKKAYDNSLKAFGPVHPRVRRTRSEWAEALKANGHLQEAEKVEKSAIADASGHSQ